LNLTIGDVCLVVIAACLFVGLLWGWNLTA
jgi:hypothetical protein